LLGLASGTKDGKGYYVHPDQARACLRRNAPEWLAAQEKRR
jgi:hypothetical protein